MWRSAEERGGALLTQSDSRACPAMWKSWFKEKKKKKAPGLNVDTYIKYKLAFRSFPFCLRFQPVLLLLW